MTDVSLIEFLSANKKTEASALYDDELLEKCFLNKFDTSDELLIVHKEQLKTPNALDGESGMSLITKKFGSSLVLHDFEQLINKKYCETRQSHETNCRGGNNLSTSEEVQSSLNHSTKYGTFENSPFSSFYMDIDTQFDEDICCGKCRESRKEKSRKFLEHGFTKY